MLSNLEHEARVAGSHGDFQGVKDRGKGAIKTHVNNGTNDLSHHTSLNANGAGITSGEVLEG